MKDFKQYQTKKEGEELQMYLHFRKRHFAVKSKKGKGSYTRKEKHKSSF